MSANIVVEEDSQWCATPVARCGLAEHVWGKGQAARRPVR
jgi:hypothetical protein